MELKENSCKKHIYTFTYKGIVKKSEYPYFFLFLDKIEEILNEFPHDKNLDRIRKMFLGIYTLFWNREFSDIFLKNTIKLEEETKKLENKWKGKLKEFIDFSLIKESKIKNLNNLRIKSRQAEILFFKAYEELKEADKRLLIIGHFLNLVSKFVFYYMLEKYYDVLKKYRGRDLIKELEQIRDYDIELYEKYKEVYGL